MASSSTAAAVRFVGMLPSLQAEVVARDCIRVLASSCPDVHRWDVCVLPPLAAPPAGGYAVRVQARLECGSVVSIRSQAGDLLHTVRDAFDGLKDLLLQQEGGEFRGAASAWMPAAGGSCQGLPA
jgi:hypothetical protein